MNLINSPSNWDINSFLAAPLFNLQLLVCCCVIITCNQADVFVQMI